MRYLSVRLSMKSVSQIAAAATIVGACSIISSSSADSAEHELQTYNFVGPKGSIKLDPTKLTLEIDGKADSLKSCSNAQFYCYYDRDRKFDFIFPRSCWAAANPKWEFNAVTVQVFGMVPESDRAAMVSSSTSYFMLEYDLGRGLVGLWYDQQGTFFKRHTQWFDLSPEQKEAHHYILENAKLAFPCAGNPDHP